VEAALGGARGVVGDAEGGKEGGEPDGDGEEEGCGAVVA
jgi:hypothetical protein